MSRRAVPVLAALLLVAACAGDSASTTTAAAVTTRATTGPTSSTGPGTTTSTSTTTTTEAGRVIEVVVSGGEVQGGARRERVAVNEAVMFRVTSDVADEVHVHGYELKGPVEAGGTVAIAFTANIPGVFEVELESADLQLVELEVR